MAERGDRGDRGVQGERGERGDHGQHGDPGKTGAPGKSASGEMGERGATGDRGVSGERGPKGDSGQHGGRGAKGLPGPTNKLALIGYLILSAFVGFSFFIQGRDSVTRQEVDADLCNVSKGLLSRQVFAIHTGVESGEVFRRTSKSAEVRAYFARTLPGRRERLVAAEAQLRALGSCGVNRRFPRQGLIP